MTELLDKAILALCEAMTRAGSEKYSRAILGELYVALGALLEARGQSLRE